MCGSVLGLVLLIGLSLSAEAATRGIPGVMTAATQMGDTVKAIGYVLAPVLIIVAILAARTEHGAGALLSIFFALIAVGVIVFADEIVATIKPGAASAATGLVPSVAGSLAGLWDLGQQALMMTGLVEGIRRGRCTRRV
jgi:hypothetical protein